MTIEIKQYMANCITRIYRAPCSIHCLRERDEDVADAVAVAAKYGLEAAHKYLIDLCNEAENGLYTPKQDAAPVPVEALPVVNVSEDGHISVEW